MKRLWHKRMAWQITSAVCFFMVMLTWSVKHSEERNKDVAYHRSHSERCSRNLSLIMNTLKQYTHDHSGRFPKRLLGEQDEQLAWIESIRPYFARMSMRLEDRLYCPYDKQRHQVSSYKFNINLYGKSIKELLRNPSTPVFTEDHSCQRKETYEVTVDLLKP